jgi:two-component system chemotaxis response regulator CheY
MEMNTLRVLVVDDSPIIARKICMMMDLIGYEVVRTAATGREAIAAYRECRPDVVTMDITMPDMDGIEATRIIRSAFPDANIVMVTSHGQEKMVLDALKAGAKGYVLKPFQQQKVFEAIEKACRRVVLVDKLDAASARCDVEQVDASDETTVPPSDTQDPE